MRTDRAKEIFNEIANYEIRLAPDPRSLGPLYLQNTIADCRNYLNMVSRIMLEIHCEKQEVSRRLRLAEVSHEVRFTEALANDERVRRLPSIEDRKATVTFLLNDGVNAINALKAELHDIEFVEKAVRHRHKELTATMSEIKLQRSLIRDEIDSGAMYGDERGFDHERGNSGPSPADLDIIGEDEIEAMLSGGKYAEQESASIELAPSPEESEPVLQASPTIQTISEKETTSTVVSDPVPEVVSASDDEAKVLEFFGKAPKQAVAENFDDVFENI